MRNKILKLDMPQEIRYGQQLFNFLEWLKTEKGFSGNQNARMADPFHIDDEKFNKLYQEFLTPPQITN